MIWYLLIIWILSYSNWFDLNSVWLLIMILNNCCGSWFFLQSLSSAKIKEKIKKNNSHVGKQFLRIRVRTLAIASMVVPCKAFDAQVWLVKWPSLLYLNTSLEWLLLTVWKNEGIISARKLSLKPKLLKMLKL